MTNKPLFSLSFPGNILLGHNFLIISLNDTV